jgi:ATP-dependent Clp protease ATP-binding subunit ClpC
MVMGEDRRGLGGQQAGCAQKAREEDQAEVPWRTTEEKEKRLVIFTRFTDRSRMCVEAALDEARILGHDSLGDEDLLLGILRADEGIGAEALSSLGVTLEGARDQSEEMLSSGLASIGISLEEVRREAGDAFELRIPDKKRIPISPWAKKALVEARKEIRMLGDNYLGTEHVLLGILRNADGTAVRMLAGMGVSPEVVEERLFELRDREAG